MSMLSAQIDRLRELATKYDEIQVGTVRAVRIPLDTGSVMREAADTILSLRDKAQELQAENAKLRERIHELEMEGSDHFYRTAYAEDANRTLEAENAKLREQSERLFDKTLELATKNDRLRELLDYALPIAMYAASAEEGDRIRELMREVEL